MVAWGDFYRTKTRQRARQAFRCPGCGRRNPPSTHSHHLFLRRPDHPYLQQHWNIIQVCPDCHLEEGSEMQVTAALMKLWDLGADTIEAIVETLPFKVKPSLPGHYWIAKALYEQGVTVEAYRHWD